MRTLIDEIELFFYPILSLKEYPYRFYEILYQNDWTQEEFEKTGLKEIVNLVEVVDITIHHIKNTFNENDNFDFETIISIAKNINKLIDTLSNISKSKFQLSDEFAIRFVEDIVNYLLINYLNKKSLFTFQFLRLLNVITQENEQSHFESGLPIIIGDSFPKIHFERLAQVFTNPGKLMEKEYWPEGFLNQEIVEKIAKKLFSKVALVIYSLGVNSIILGYREENDSAIDEDDLSKRSISFYHDFPIETGDFTKSNGLVMLSIALLTNKEGAPGVMIIPAGNFEYKHDLGKWKVAIGTGLEVGGFKINKDGFSFIENGIVNTGVDFSFSLSKLKEPESDTIFFIGNEKGTNFSIGDFGITGTLKLSTNTIDYGVYVNIKELSIVIKGKDRDSFLSKILGEEGINSKVDIEIGYSNTAGFHIKGSGGLEIILALHIEIGPLFIDNLKIGLYLKEQGLSLQAGATIGAKLGPIALTVEDLGLQSQIPFSSKDSFNLGFKPPNGIGLSIDATAVKGGGYLFIDTDKGLYYGAAELSIKETVNVTAVGIINTKLPDGSEGYSFLLLISAEFTPIQLGMGFTLSGVGGLVGIHRGMIIEALASGVKNNTLDHILYPENPVANAPAIVASLNNFFPIQQDQFTFGIMLKLGWGTPNLVDIELGLIISLPDPIKIAIVGILKLVLPDAKAPVVKLQVNFIGAIDFKEKYFFFYATLFDSELLIFKVEGSMYFSIEWGSQPYFVFTIGGFHPTFKAPKLRGGIAQEDIKRLQLRLLESDNPKILLQFYFAVTSNTVQFGAALDFKLDLEIFKVLGWFYFDALFQFNPFYFNIQLSAGLQVFIGDSPILGIAFKGMLEGPTPWRIQGYARFSYWFITAEVKINETFGEAPKDLIQPSVEALPILIEALKADGNWQLIKYKSYTDTVLTRGVVVVQEKEDVGTDSATDKIPSALIAHPDARVIISQTKIPLNQNIDKIGEQKVLDFSHFKIEADIDGDNIPDNLGTTEDFFAISQYKALTNEEKLTKSSFELMGSGLEMSSDKLSTGDDTVCTELEYEMQIIDTHGFVEDKQTQKLSAFLYNDFTLQNAIHTSVIGRANTLTKLDLIKTATIKKPIPVKNKFHNYSIVDRFDLANAKPITLTAFELAIHEH